MRKNYFVLPLIIILLIFFLPCAIYGVYNKLSVETSEGNPEHLHKFENKLYFYDNSNNLITIYNCENTVCDYAQSVVDDEYLNYYQGDNNTLGIFASDYVFIQDGDVIKLYNLKTNITIAQFYQIKNYGTVIADGYIIIKNADGYGIFNTNAINYAINPKYDFIGINERYLNEESQNQRYAVKEQNSWFLISIEDEALSLPNDNPIYDYNDNYIVYLDSDSEYLIYDYNGNRIISEENIMKIDILNNYFVINTSTGDVKIYNSDLTNIIKEYHEDSTNLTYKIANKSIDILNDEEVFETFNLLDEN